MIGTAQTQACPKELIIKRHQTKKVQKSNDLSKITQGVCRRARLSGPKSKALSHRAIIPLLKELV